MLSLTNRFLNTLPGDPNPNNHSRQVHGAFWSRVTPARVAAPSLLLHSPEVAAMLGLSDAQMRSPEMLAALSGNGLLPGMETYATAYAGHQFGNWAGQLGDGQPFDLAAWRAAHAGRPLLLYFWAEWCPICRTTSGSVSNVSADWPVTSTSASERTLATQNHVAQGSDNWRRNRVSSCRKSAARSISECNEGERAERDASTAWARGLLRDSGGMAIPTG